MKNVRKETINGINEQLQELRKPVENQTVRVITKFSGPENIRQLCKHSNRRLKN